MTNLVSRKVIITLLSLLAIVMVLIGAYYYQQSTKNRVDLNRLNEVAIATNLDEEVKVENLQVVVDKVDRGEIRTSLQVPEGQQWLNLHIVLENLSEEESTDMLSEYYLVDSQGNKYPTSITNMTNRNSPRFDPYKSLTPNAQTNGWLGFTIPDDASGLMLAYVTRGDNPHTFIIKL